MEGYSPFTDSKSLTREFRDYSVDEQSDSFSSEGDESIGIEESHLISKDFMASQEGKMSSHSAKLASSVVDKKDRQELVQQIIRDLKNSKKPSVLGSALNNVEAETAFTDHGGVNSEGYSSEYIDDSNHASQVHMATESRRKPNNRIGSSRKICGDRKKNRSHLNSSRMNNEFTHENQPSVMKSFNGSALSADDFSVCSPQNSCQEDGFELFLDENGAHTLRPYDGFHDLKVTRKNKLKNNMRVQRNAQEFEDFSDYSTVQTKFCGVPSSSYRRQKDKIHNSKRIAGKEFVPSTNMTNGLHVAPNNLGYQQLFQFESDTDSEQVSSDAYPIDETPLLRSLCETPLLRSLCETQTSSCSSFNEQFGFGLETYFNELELRDMTKTRRRARKPGARECDTEKESIRRRNIEPASMHKSLSEKYSPKSFKELVGHNIVAQALCNAVSKGRIVPYYLFHGPRGTGKTSTGRLFGAALNCMADCNQKPCWNCNGCSKSPQVTEMDASSRCVDIERMKSFLRNIKFSESVSRYQVFIVDECQILTPEAWTVLLNCLEERSSSVVFIMVTTDVSKLPRVALSRCQKFHFPKLKYADIYAKLEMIVAAESIGIEEDALHLIAAKADGSLRDAEITLDELSLLGTNVTKAMVNQLVGLVPDERLVTLLGLALSADTLGTVRSIREIIESGVQPLVLVGQLASLITDILAGVCVPSSWLQEKTRLSTRLFSSRGESKRLRRALKILLETEKQLKSSNDQTTWITAALLQFAPDELYQFYATPLHTSLIQSPVVFLDTIEKEAIGSEHSAEENWEHYQLQLELKSPQTLERMTNINSSLGKSPIVSDLVCDFPENATSHFQNRKHIHQRRQSSIHSQKLNVIFEDLSGITETDHLHAQTPDSLVDVRETGQKELKLMSLGNTEEIWLKVLESIQPSHLKELLQGRGKLSSVFVFKARAVVHLMFRHTCDKEQAERSETNLSNAFNEVLGFPVEVKIRLGHDKSDEHESSDEHENAETSTADFSRNQEGMPHSEEKKILTSKALKRQNSRGVKILPRYRRRNRIVGMPDRMHGPCESDINKQEVSSDDDEVLEKCSIDEDNLTRKDLRQTEEKRNDEQFNDVHVQTVDWESQERSFTSLGTNSSSFIHQADGSVDAYSQDLLFDHVSSRRKHGSGRRFRVDFMEEKDSYPRQGSMEPKFHSKHRGPVRWNEVRIKEHKWKQRRVKYLLKFAPCTESFVEMNATQSRKRPVL